MTIFRPPEATVTNTTKAAIDFDLYCMELSEKAEKLAQEDELKRRAEHLGAYNFGRSAQRLEDARRAFWLRVRWFLAGAFVGLTLALGFLQVIHADQILLNLER